MFLILGFDMYASTTTSSVTLFVTAGVLWLKLVRLYRLATLLPSSFLPRQFFSILKRFWALLKSPERFKYPLFPFFPYCTFYFLTNIFHMHVFLFFLVFLSFCLVCVSFSSFSAHIFTVFSLAIFHCFSYKLGGCVSPDIQLHPATYQCTGMYLHSGALLQRQRNALLSVPSASYQKVHYLDIV